MNKTKKRRKDILESLVTSLLEELNVDLEEGDLASTPERVARTFLELTRSYEQEPPEVKRFQLPQSPAGEEQVIVIGDLHFFSLCEHHLLPFEGSVTVAYIPRGYIVGLSKPARCVEYFSHKLMIQERFAKQLADYLFKKIEPEALGVRVKARHLCSAMRGVESREHYIETTKFRFAGDCINIGRLQKRLEHYLRGGDST